jgi:hypothetical protein
MMLAERPSAATQFRERCANLGDRFQLSGSPPVLAVWTRHMGPCRGSGFDQTTTPGRIGDVPRVQVILDELPSPRAHRHHRSVPGGLEFRRWD